jgi:two-component system, sensor histidine kinase and response regulator
MTKDKPTLLIVEDSRENVDILVNLLGSHYHLKIALNGEKALEILNASALAPDLILLDIIMPGMDGFQVCEKIKEDPRTKYIPIIFLTGKADYQNIVKGFQAGGVDYVTKPFQSDELMYRVHTHLELKNKKGELQNVIKSIHDEIEQRIEQLHQLNKKLSDLNQAIEKAHSGIEIPDEAKTAFYQLITQEISKPLGSRLWIKNLSDPATSSVDINELDQILNKSINRLYEFWKKIDLVTRLKTQDFTAQKSNVSFPVLMQTLLIELNEPIKNKKLQMNVNIADDFSIVAASDLARICLKEIILNAISHSDMGGMIKINGLYENQDKIIEIVDHGAGFPAEVLQNLSSQLPAVEENRNLSRGIGLTLAKLIMNVHSGKIDISNNKDKGARVRLVFPESKTE